MQRRHGLLRCRDRPPSLRRNDHRQGWRALPAGCRLRASARQWIPQREHDCARCPVRRKPTIVPLRHTPRAEGPCDVELIAQRHKAHSARHWQQLAWLGFAPAAAQQNVRLRRLRIAKTREAGSRSWSIHAERCRRAPRQYRCEISLGAAMEFGDAQPWRTRPLRHRAECARIRPRQRSQSTDGRSAAS